jgi:hypothetical protein
MDHATRAVLAQRQVAGASEEVPAFAPLLAPLDLAGVVVTADVLQTHPEAAEFLVGEQRAHYLFVVKANQPLLPAGCQRLPWHRVPVLDRTGDRGHGRVRSGPSITACHVTVLPVGGSPTAHRDGCPSTVNRATTVSSTSTMSFSVARASGSPAQNRRMTS